MQNLIALILAGTTIYLGSPVVGLAASIRTVNHALESARIGADVMTAPPAVIKSMINHPLTDKGLASFLEDIKFTKQKIL